MYINKVELSSYLAKAPDVRYLPSGTPVANARLGQTNRYNDAKLQPQEHTNWHSLSFYGDLSKIAATFNRGDHIFVEGTIEQRQFTPKDGSTRTINEIVVRHCHLIAPPRHAAPNEVNREAQPGGEAHEESWPVR